MNRNRNRRLALLMGFTLFAPMSMHFMAEADPAAGGGGGGGEGGGGGGDPAAELIATKKQLNEFRDNNRKMSEAQVAMQDKLKRFEGIDPEEYAAGKKALDLIMQQEDGQLLKDGKLDEVVKKRTGKIVADYEAKLQAKDKAGKDAAERLTTITQKYNKRMIEVATGETMNAIGTLKPGALPLITRMFSELFSVGDDDSIVSKAPINAAGDPQSMDEYGRGLLQTHGWLFEGGGGGSAPGGKKSTTNADGVKVVPRSQRMQYAKEISAGKVKVDPNS